MARPTPALDRRGVPHPRRSGLIVKDDRVELLEGELGRFPKPEEVVLVAEVANTILATDLNQKSGICVRADFTEYWILNLADRQLEVFRFPLPSGVYAEAHVLVEKESVAFEGREPRVADLLP